MLDSTHVPMVLRIALEAGLHAERAQVAPSSWMAAQMLPWATDGTDLEKHMDFERARSGFMGGHACALRAPAFPALVNENRDTTSTLVRRVCVRALLVVRAWWHNSRNLYMLIHERNHHWCVVA